VVKKITYESQVSLEFSTQMNFTDTVMQLINEQQFNRTKTLNLNGTTPVDENLILEVSIVPGLDQSLENIRFHWNISKIDNFTVTVDLYFSSALLISQFGSLDTLVAEIRQPAYFRDTRGSEILPKHRQRVKEIPRQVERSPAITFTKIVATVAINATRVVLASNVVLNWILSYSLNMLWGIISSMQIVVHFPLTSVAYPANASLFNSYFLTIATFDVLPTDDINAYFFTFHDGEPIAKNFEDFGYEKRNFIQNLGSIYYFFPLVAIWLLLLVLLKLLALSGFSGPQKWYLWLKNKLFWNFLLRLLIESYLELHLSSTINAANLYWSSNSGDWLASLTTLPVAFVVNAFPIWLFMFLRRNHERLSEEEFKARFGATYEGLVTESKTFIGHPLIFILRRMLFSFMVVLIRDLTFLQI